MNEIRIWDRRAGREEVERIYGESFMRWVYGTASGRRAGELALSRRPFSFLYGLYQSSAVSRRKIAPFIREFGIPMEEYETGPFASFNDFFIRRFRPGQRVFAVDPKALPAFAEGRYLAFERVDADTVFPVKGSFLTAEALLGIGNDGAGANPSHGEELEQRRDLIRPFIGGPLLIARLCPTDYHRFHFPDDGRELSHYRVHGRLHSVSPIALRCRGDILATNERQVSILETASFGKLAYVEVGALCVGRIEQTYDASQPFKRGDEKGYFLFGGSTVVLLGEPGRWRPDEDLLAQTRAQRETFVRLGDAVARS